MLLGLKTFVILYVMFCAHMKAIGKENGKVVIKIEGFRKLALRWSFETEIYCLTQLCLTCSRLRDSRVRVRKCEHETNGGNYSLRSKRFRAV